MAGTLAGCAALGAMVDPALDDPGREWCYLGKSTTVIGVPWQPDVVQITFDGALYTGYAELCFFHGNPPQAVMARQKTFLDGWIPIVQYDWRTGEAGYVAELFSAVLEGENESNALQFVRVTVTNFTAETVKATLTAACRGSGEDCRFGKPVFDGAWTFAITDNALVRNGQWVYGFEPGAHSVEAVAGVPYTQPFRGTTYGLTPRVEAGLATYHVRLEPGQSQTYHFKMPRVPVPVTNPAFLGKIAAADYDRYRSNTVAMWRQLVGSRCRISLPEARVEHAHRASVVHALLATRTHGRQRVQTDGLPYPGCYPSTFFDYEQLYDTMQLPDCIGPTAELWLHLQATNGVLPITTTPYATHGRVLMGLASQILYRQEAHEAATIYPKIQRAVAFIGSEHHARTNGLLGPTHAYDNEMIGGYWTSDNLWALAALRKCIGVARFLNQTQDVACWTALHESYEAAVLRALQSSAAPDGYVPTGLGLFLTGAAACDGLAEYQTDQDWENVLLAWPSEALDPADPKVQGTVARLHATRFHEGIMSYRNGMHLHQYITGNVIMQEIVAGQARDALVDLYHVLLHCGSTHEVFENMVPPWEDRMLSPANYRPPPHAWGSAKLANTIRNLLVMEYGGRQGLDAGRRNLMLFSVLSPAWAIPGQTVSVSHAATEFGTVSAAITFREDGAGVVLSNFFTTPPGRIVIRIPYFVTNAAFQSDALEAGLTNNMLHLSPDATRVEFTWQWNLQADETVFQDVLLSYRREPPFWPGARAEMPVPPEGFLTMEEEGQAPLPLSFATILKTWQHEYSRRYSNFVAEGGQPTVIVAPPMVVAQTGTLLHYGFGHTSGTVAGNGPVLDRSGKGNHGAVLSGDGGAYTNDVPDSNRIQHCTGIGSLDLASGSITTDPTGALSGHGVVSWTDILRNGGLTVEVWAKGGTGWGHILSLAAVYCLEATPLGVRCANGFGRGSVDATLNMGQWHHLAARFMPLTLNSHNQLVADMQLFVDGQWRGTCPASVFLEDLQRGAALGNHPMVTTLGYQVPFRGLVYEPRVTLGALNPSQFTFKPLPPSLVFEPTPAGLVLTWASGTLESAPAVTGPWTAVAGAASPCTHEFGPHARFFRVIPAR
ncbi:MAG: hypothetical protein JXQ71_10145 [Verrucomicrobia bacterium]|nr:hypothetical protein [Verrucomicrobiota bacterium]